MSKEKKYENLFSKTQRLSRPRVKRAQAGMYLIDSLQTKGDPVRASKPKADRLARVVHWRSNNGKWVVVAGPFPDNFYRSETRGNAAKASVLLVDDCFNRPGTTLDTAYAKVLAADILEIDSGENEFGVVTP